LTPKTIFAEFNNGTCSSVTRTQVTLTITPAPNAPTVTSNAITQCEQNPMQTLDANTLLASTTGITWYDAATNGNVTTSTNNTLTPKTIFAEFNNGTCSSVTRTQVTLTITPAPNAPTVTSNAITQCEQNPMQTLDANTLLASTTGITWYDAATNGNVTTSTNNTLTPKTIFAEFNNGTCSSVTRTQVTLTITPAPNAPTTTDTQQAFCAESSPTVADLAVTPNASGDIKWYNSLTSTTALNLNDALTSGTYYASEIVAGCESINRTLVLVTVTELAVMTPQEGCEDTDYTLNILNTNQDTGITYQWFDSSDTNLGVTTSKMIIKNPGVYKVRVYKNTCFDEYTFDVDFAYCEIPKGISPNNDGKNDIFDLSNLHVKHLQIFNRYGMEMYSKTNYTKEWDGYSNAGQNLPDGTYYYVIHFESGKTKTGWVYKNSEN
jgi:gliding motility-associated-like protein